MKLDLKSTENFMRKLRVCVFYLSVGVLPLLDEMIKFLILQNFKI